MLLVLGAGGALFWYKKYRAMAQRCRDAEGELEALQGRISKLNDFLVHDHKHVNQRPYHVNTLDLFIFAENQEQVTEDPSPVFSPERYNSSRASTTTETLLNMTVPSCFDETYV